MKVRMTVISPLGTFVDDKVDTLTDAEFAECERILKSGNLDFATVKVNGEKLYFQKEIIQNSIVSIKILE